MGKHVCPVCETVYAVRGVLTVQLVQTSKDYECWQCPACGYRFMAVIDTQELLESMLGQHAPKLIVRLVDQALSASN
jgi:hypothetical protein